MEIRCSNPKCKAPLLKSYGSTYKLRSRSIRWDSLNETAIVQCNMCRAMNSVPLELKISGEQLVLELGTEIKKAAAKEHLIIPADTKKSEKKQ